MIVKSFMSSIRSCMFFGSFHGCFYLCSHRFIMQGNCLAIQKTNAFWRIVFSSTICSKPSVEQIFSAFWKQTAGRSRKRMQCLCCLSTGENRDMFVKIDQRRDFYSPVNTTLLLVLFRVMLYKLYEELRKDDLDVMKFLLSEKLGRRQTEKCNVRTKTWKYTAF